MYHQFLKNSLFYNVDNIKISVLEMHWKDEKTDAFELTDVLKYSERHSFEITDLNHVDFTNFAPLYTAAFPKGAKQNSPIAVRKNAYEPMSGYILDFFDVYLKAKKQKR
jgi:hypothetical protein